MGPYTQPYKGETGGESAAPITQRNIMLKNLWYRIFGHPSVDTVMADFQKIHDKLRHVVDIHSAISAEKDKIIAEAAVARAYAETEVTKAWSKIQKIKEWL